MKKVMALVMAAVLTMGMGVSCANQGTSTAAGTSQGQAVQGVKDMAGTELDKIMEDKKMKEDYTVIDVRSKEEYDAGHVKWAVNMNVDELAGKLANIEDLKDKNVVTICNTGKKSAKAAKILADAGFKKVFNAQGVKDFKYTTMTKVANVRGAQFAELAKAGTSTIVDSRDLKDYEAGHLQGAISVLVNEADTKMSQIPKDKPVLVYCYSGNKSMEVAEKLAQAGYHVTNALDGTKEYNAYELVK